MSEFRIVSLLPAATEMLAALGLEESLVGIGHECDWPPSVRALPVVSRARENMDHLPPWAVDEIVRERKANGESLYEIDEELLADLHPTHIIAQDLCQVCAPSGHQLAQVLSVLPNPPEAVFLSPRDLTSIAQNMRDLGAAFRRVPEAEVMLIEWKARMDDVQARVATRPRVRCFVMEWADPVYCSGHWVAEMVQMAGGYDLLARPGQESRRVEWAEVCASAPEVLIIAPCGYNLDHASDQLAHLKTLPGWEELPAVQSKRVYAVNADAFITRPGPRVVDGVEMLAYLLHGG